jgi:hypothetical protein
LHGRGRAGAASDTQPVVGTRSVNAVPAVGSRLRFCSATTIGRPAHRGGRSYGRLFPVLPLRAARRRQPYGLADKLFVASGPGETFVNRERLWRVAGVGSTLLFCLFMQWRVILIAGFMWSGGSHCGSRPHRLPFSVIMFVTFTSRST